MSSSSLFPPVEPYATGRLPVDDLHELYWEESGNRAGVPVLFLHGGPGAGAGRTHRRFFDPQHYRIIIFDQRGAGRSRPFAETRGNSPDLLIADIEKLRALRGVERWHIFGGSWGSTLALSYAQAHPARCLSLILRGIFLATQREIDWFMHGMRRIFPEAWEAFAARVPVHERGNLLAAYAVLLNNPDPAIHAPAAKAWAEYERICARLLPDREAPGAAESAGDSYDDLAIARIEAHYFTRHVFAPTRLLDGAARLRAIPAVIVHGRYDMICPIDAAYALHRAWPEADFQVIADAGHSALEPGICRALVAATERFKAVAA